MKIVPFFPMLTLVVSLFSAVTFAAPDAATYQYDAQGRVTRITWSNGSYVAYAYDAEGNRVTVGTTCSSAGC